MGWRILHIHQNQVTIMLRFFGVVREAMPVALKAISTSVLNIKRAEHGTVRLAEGLL